MPSRIQAKCAQANYHRTLEHLGFYGSYRFIEHLEQPNPTLFIVGNILMKCAVILL